MNVLMTGVRKDYLCVREHNIINENDCCSEAVIRALEMGGHTVDVRQVHPGEDLRDYAAVIVGIDDPQAFGTKPFLGALWCLAQRRCGGPQPMALFTHWNLKSMMSGLEQVNKHEYKLFSDHLKYDGMADARRYEALLREELQALTDGDWPPTVINAFQWGDHSLLAADAPFEKFDMTFDPTELMHSRSMNPGMHYAGTRRREWIVGTHEPLSRWVSSLNLTWPVRHFGDPRSGAPFSLPKRELILNMRGAIGALAPPYKHKGSGYWRARFVHAADAVNIMLADKEEIGPLNEFAVGMGSPFELQWGFVEEASDRQLSFIAKAQRATLFSQTESKENVIWKFNEAIKVLALTYGAGKRPQYVEPPARTRPLF